MIHDLVGEGVRLFRSEHSPFLVERVEGTRTKAKAGSGKRPIVFIPGRWWDGAGERFTLGPGGAEKPRAGFVVAGSDSSDR